ncbi:hypothetical protein O1611_g6614 [Lasiodiplodia mahajangana]|uniref:Uncharacterized protein n=1 Tax=Lasiodiplodia mahajangana TaxID=1108764 RepID=A0ACC2JHN3_9PEZI|nr:hypothetical protein O1611_g6614 [Lasiodiplodia mahajangana]
MGADCCGKKPTTPQLPAEAARDSCCSASATECNESVTDCCTPGNEKCNEECLKTVAATLCAEGVGAHTDDHNGCGTEGCCSDKNQASACDAHLQMAFAQYQSFLDNVRCICRSMIERGYKSCCQTSEVGAQGPNSVPSGPSGCKDIGIDCCKPSAKPTADKKAGCCSTDKPKSGGGCCSDQVSVNRCSSEEQLVDCCGSKKRLDTCCNSKAAQPGNVSIKQKFDDCCGDNQKPADGCGSKIGKKNCCGEKKTSSCSSSGSSLADRRDDCCGGKAKPVPDSCCSIEKKYQLISPQVNEKNGEIDVEKGSGEEVRISVTGMTCNGCSENLERNLAANGANNIRINYLQGHADFTFDPALDLSTIIVKTREATGFQISIMAGDESITVLTSGSRASTALAQIELNGVEDVVVLNKSTVRIQYNPTIIGARELFHKIEHLSVGLAPPQNDQQLASGRKRFIRLLIQTIASFVLTIPVLVLAWGEVHIEEDTKAIISLVLGTLVQFLAVPVFYKPALQSLLRYGVLELDMLVVIAITAAFVYSIVAFGYLIEGTPLETAAFFETSSLLISLVMLGRLVASYARIRAVAAVSVRSLQASTAILVEDGVDLESRQTG